MTTFPRLAAAELTKIRTLRSTAWTLVLAFVITVAFGVGVSFYLSTTFDRLGAESRATFDPSDFAMSMVEYGQLVLVVFGVLVVGSEYRGGTIRAALAAVPRRSEFYRAKMFVGGALAFAVSELTVFVMYFGSQAALGSHGGAITDPGVFGAVFGTGLYLTMIAVISMGVTAMLRSPAVAIGTLIPFFFMVSNILGHVPGVRVVGQFLPDQAGNQIIFRHYPTGSVLGPWTGLLVMAAWTALALAGGYLVLRSRDA
ncbi:ABC transporter permease [Actinokineospora enzanensis]|uniref:ABC transporter permease n=1 Tax=Actinokineospora enzanensis TaxID=155975 RepID=UPI0003750379|nr:ABC transporter permease [Actinokineospora enzanensis]